MQLLEFDGEINRIPETEALPEVLTDLTSISDGLRMIFQPYLRSDFSSPIIPAKTLEKLYSHLITRGMELV